MGSLHKLVLDQKGLCREPGLYPEGAHEHPCTIGAFLHAHKAKHSTRDAVFGICGICEVGDTGAVAVENDLGRRIEGNIVEDAREDIIAVSLLESDDFACIKVLGVIVDGDQWGWIHGDAGEDHVSAAAGREVVLSVANAPVRGGCDDCSGVFEPFVCYDLEDVKIEHLVVVVHDE